MSGDAAMTRKLASRRVQLAYLCSLGPHSLLEEEDDSGDAVVEAAEQLLQLVGVPGILSDVAVLFHPFLQVFKLKIQS